MKEGERGGGGSHLSVGVASLRFDMSDHCQVVEVDLEPLVRCVVDERERAPRTSVLVGPDPKTTNIHHDVTVCVKLFFKTKEQLILFVLKLQCDCESSHVGVRVFVFNGDEGESKLNPDTGNERRK